MKSPQGCPHGWKCPRTNDPEQKSFCHHWWEMMYAHTATGEEKLLKDCGYRLTPLIHLELIKASNRPAAAVESCRNEIAQGFQVLAGGVKAMSLGADLVSVLPPPSPQPSPPGERGLKEKNEL